jgi:hypothetical protein
MLRLGIILTLALGGTTLAGEQAFAPKNPLAGLPSKAEGTHLEKLKALGDNSWADLGPPAADPKWGKARGRAWTPKMAYAPELRGAFFCATGVHGFVKPDGHYMDDLWLYDLNAHRWVCLYPGADTKTLKLHLDKDGFEINEAGEHIPVSYLSHGYNNLTYNPDLHKYMIIHTQCPWWTTALPQRYDWLGIPADKRTYGNVGPVIASAKHPWFWDATEGKWDRKFIAGDGPSRGRFEGVLEYVPSQKKAHYSYSHGELWIYDFATSSWSRSPVDFKAPVYDSVACLDTKRERIYMGSGKQFWIYDAAKQTWSTAAAANLPAGFGGGVSSNLTYDSVNDVAVLNRYGRGDKNDPQPLGLYTYDPEKNSWSTEVTPLPASARGQITAFYDPEFNAHYYHAAGDSSDKGTMLAYRYKNTKK